MFENIWRPVNDRRRARADLERARSAIGSTNFGVIASVNHSYKEQYIDEDRRFYRIGDADALEATSDYHIQTGTQRAQLGIVANFSYQFSTNQRLSFENFYTHTGHDEGRFFEGQNLDNARDYQNSRLQFIEEGLFSNAVERRAFLPESLEQPTRLASQFRPRLA